MALREHEVMIPTRGSACNDACNVDSNQLRLPLPIQVLETRAERQCVVGWFRESCERPEPDLDPMSLRTIRGLDKRATVVSCVERAKHL